MDWSHLRTILWLRWRLSRNQWSRGGGLNAVLTMVFFIAGVILGFVGAVVGILVGSFPLAKVKPLALLGVWDVVIVGFLFFWLIGLISELQRSETIDIGRMLHLPVHLRDIFIVNYVASHLTGSLILFVPGMLGLSLGLTLSRGPAMLLMIPLVLGLIFTVTAWTYCLRGWLGMLMSNPRRRRAIIAGITFTVIVLSQLPNAVMQWARVDHDKGPGIRVGSPAPPSEQSEEIPARSVKPTIPGFLLTAHKIVPFLWVGNGAKSLAQGDVLPALLGAAGTIGLGALGLRRAYRSTVRFYQGQAVSKKSEVTSKPRTVRRSSSRRRSLTRQLPGISEEASVMALTTFRSIARAPEIKQLVAQNLIIFLIFGGSVVMRRAGHVSDAFKPFFCTGAIVVTFFGLNQLMLNLFGFDRTGFRSFVLLPTPRDRILLGKNLALLPIALTIGSVLIAVVAVFVKVPPLTILASILQLIAGFFLLSIVGNWVSALVPHRIAPGTTKATKVSSTTRLLIVVFHLLFPVTMGPIFLAPALSLLISGFGWLPASVANLILSAVLMASAILIYRLTLPPLGQFLQRRERDILQIVTHEIE